MSVKPRIRRSCADCPRDFSCSAHSKKRICPVCDEVLRMEGVKDKQPADPSVYQPRFNGVQHFDREDES